MTQPIWKPRREAWTFMLVLAITLVVYGQVRRYAFVNYDDWEYVTKNPHVTAGLTSEGLSWAFASGEAGNWHPLTWISHMADVELFGLNAGMHHFVNVLLHLANALLLFGLLNRMTGFHWRSLFVAGVFALHPLHVESVAWVAERKEVLCTVFWLLSLWAYLRYVKKPGSYKYLSVLLLFSMALMAKPMAVTLPFVLLSLDFWPLKRLALQTSATDVKVKHKGRPHGQNRGLGLLLCEKGPFFLLSAAASIATFIVQKHGAAVVSMELLPAGTRVANAIVSYVVYIEKMFWPTRLAVFYPFSSALPVWQVVVSSLGLSAISVSIVLAIRRYPYLSVGWFWYLGTLVPVIGLIQVGDQARADRYMYVPMIGLLIMLSWGVSDLLRKLPKKELVVVGLSGVVLSVCSVLTWFQVQTWRDTTALFTHALEVTTDNPVAHNGLGIELAGAGNLQGAVEQYHEALRFNPHDGQAHTNLGIALALEGKNEEAIPHFVEAARLQPENADVHYNFGNTLASQGRGEEAIAQYLEALRLKPDHADVQNNLGSALASQGLIDQAIVHFSEALRLRPDFVEARRNLDSALAIRNRSKWP